MRELKFRAWDKITKRYYDVSGLEFGENGDLCEIYLAGIQIDESNPTAHVRMPSDVILEQDTGIKDKNGKEIYDGDILGGIYEHGYIAYCDKCKQSQFFDADMGCMMCSGDIYWRDIVESEHEGELEVIGNIHENGDLLNVD